jgi:hypothetical protein
MSGARSPNCVTRPAESESKLLDATRAYLRGAHPCSGMVEGEESHAFARVCRHDAGGA